MNQKITIRVQVDIEELGGPDVIPIHQMLETECNNVDQLIGFFRRFSLVTPEQIKEWSK